MKKQTVDLAFRRLELKKSKVISLSQTQVSQIKGGDGNTIILQPKPIPTTPPPLPPAPPEPRPDSRDSRAAGCTIAGGN